MSTIFRTSINYREHPPQMQEFTEPSMTQPDEVMSVKEMLVRHVRGLPVAGSPLGEPMYYDEDLGYVPSIQELDLSEIADLRDRYRETVERLQQEEEMSKIPKSGEADKPQTSAGQLGGSDSDPEPSSDN